MPSCLSSSSLLHCAPPPYLHCPPLIVLLYPLCSSISCVILLPPLIVLLYCPLVYLHCPPLLSSAPCPSPLTALSPSPLPAASC